MNCRVKNEQSNLLLVITTILMISLTSCHFGFPDCEEDANFAHLKGRIAAEHDLNPNSVQLSKINETGLEDLGLGSNVFICKCSARFFADDAYGSISYQVKRDKNVFSTRLINSMRLDSYEITDNSSESINKLIDNERFTNPQERFDFDTSGPKLNRIYPLIFRDSVENFHLVKEYQLNNPSVAYDSEQAFEDFKLFNVLLEFRNSSVVLFYILQPDMTTLQLSNRYHFRVVQKFAVPIDKHFRNQSEMVECSRKTTEVKGNYLFISKTLAEDSINRKSDTVAYAWKIYESYNKGAFLRYAALETNPWNLACTDAE